MSQTFAQVIRFARKQKGYSQRKLAQLIGLDFTYLSKLENNRVNYAPKEDAIRALAKHLDLNEEELIFLAGRIPKRDSQLLKQHYHAMPALFRRIRDDENFVAEFLENTVDNACN